MSNSVQTGQNKPSILICEYGFLAAFIREEKFAGWSFNKGGKENPKGIPSFHRFLVTEESFDVNPIIIKKKDEKMCCRSLRRAAFFTTNYEQTSSSYICNY
jgi:hypothetical protein